MSDDEENNSEAGSEEIDESELCAKCKKVVYFVERGPIVGDQIYHKDCFRCTHCNHIIIPGKFTDNKGKPYCDTCYQRVIWNTNTSHKYGAPGEIDNTVGVFESFFFSEVLAHWFCGLKF